MAIHTRNQLRHLQQESTPQSSPMTLPFPEPSLSQQPNLFGSLEPPDNGTKDGPQTGLPSPNMGADDSPPVMDQQQPQRQPHHSSHPHPPTHAYEPPLRLQHAPCVTYRTTGYMKATFGEPVKLLGSGTSGRVHLHRPQTTLFTVANTASAPPLYERTQPPHLQQPQTHQPVSFPVHLVAVKTHIFPPNTSITRRLRMMDRESRMTLALNHPNIVRTYEYIFEANDEQTDGVFYSVMEYCAGDLFEYVNGIRGPLTKSLVESIFLQVVDAVHYLHNLPNRVAHRDLKMDNICVLEDGTVKLIDFGGSRTLPEDSNTIIGVCGSDPYLSPEVANDPNTPYNPLALDVWSLGIVYVAMCSGHFPWEVAKKSDANFRLYIQYGAPLIDHWLEPEMMAAKNKSNPSIKSSGLYSKNLGPLIKSMLLIDPLRRPTIDLVVAHPAFQQLMKDFIAQQ